MNAVHAEIEVKCYVDCCLSRLASYLWDSLRSVSGDMRRLSSAGFPCRFKRPMRRNESYILPPRACIRSRILKPTANYLPRKSFEDSAPGTTSNRNLATDFAQSREPKPIANVLGLWAAKGMSSVARLVLQNSLGKPRSSPGIFGRQRLISCSDDGVMARIGKGLRLPLLRTSNIDVDAASSITERFLAISVSIATSSGAIAVVSPRNLEHF
jgi:hypothetical protein